MSISKKFKELTDIIFATGVSFKADIVKIYKERDERIAFIKETYREHTPQYKEEIAKAEKKAEESLTKLRVDYSKGVISLANEIEQAETLAMTIINTDALARIKAVSELPLTTAELLALNGKYGIDDYWCSRAISELAEKNGVSAYEIGVTPSYDIKMDILHQCINQFNAFIKEYKPNSGDRLRNNDELRIEVGVSSDVMDRAYQLFIGQKNVLSDKEVVSKSLLGLMSARTDVEKGLIMGNILRNTKNNQSARAKILCEIALDKTISDLAIEMSGYSDEIVSFKTGKAEEYKSAEKAVDAIKNIKDKQLIEMRIVENQGNDFFVGMMHNESKRNSLIKEVWSSHVVKEVEGNTTVE